MKSFQKFKNLSQKYCYLSSMVFLVIIQIINTQNFTTVSSLKNTNSLNLEYDGVLGIGWGVFSIIISLFVGLGCCIYGFSTIYGLLFYSIGFAIPIITFIFMTFAPLEVDGEVNMKENSSKNNFIIARWFFFILISVASLTLFIPYMKLWTIVLIPQRVDSRTQKEYYEKLEKMYGNKKEDDGSNKINEEDPKKQSIFNEPEILPLNNQYVPPSQQQDVEMANMENLVNKEKKRKLGVLKRNRNNIEEENL